VTRESNHQTHESLPPNGEGYQTSQRCEYAFHAHPSCNPHVPQRNSTDRLAFGRTYIEARLKKIDRSGTRAAAHPDRSHAPGAGTSSVVSASDGAISCLEYLLSELQKHAKSKDASCKAGTFLSEQPNSLKSPKSYGPTKLRLVSQQSPAVTNEPQSDGYQASLNRRSASFTPSTLKSSANICGND